MIVLDSSFLIAYHNERDVHHAAAQVVTQQFLDEKWGAEFLLEYVFLEIMTVLLVRRDLSTATRVGKTLLGARGGTSFHVRTCFWKPWELSRRRRAHG